MDVSVSEEEDNIENLTPSKEELISPINESGNFDDSLCKIKEEEDDSFDALN